MTKPKRETAYHVWIKQILESKYTVQEGWLPNYVKINTKKVSKVNLIGTVIDSSSKVLKIDDSSGIIQVRTFDDLDLTKYQVGSFVRVIGMIREYENEKYVVPEIIRLTEREWLLYRKQQLPLENKVQNEEEVVEENIEEVEIDKDETEERVDKIEEAFNLIKELDKGDGADHESLVEKVGEEVIQKLLANGDIFEFKPGKIKLL